MQATIEFEFVMLKDALDEGNQMNNVLCMMRGLCVLPVVCV
jgi:hypothetical protein